MLLVLDIIVYMSILVVVIFPSVIHDNSALFIASDVYWVLNMWILTAVSGYSFLRIAHKTRQLEDVGIFANKKFMAAYFACICGSSVLDTIGVSLLIAQ